MQFSTGNFTVPAIVPKDLRIPLTVPVHADVAVLMKLVVGTLLNRQTYCAECAV